MNKEYYIDLRNKYRPDNLVTIFVLESPPASGKYFYDESGRVTEPLFKGLMKALGYKALNKQDGLLLFSDKGLFLVDATYQPVNEMKGKLRNDTILSDFKNLVADLNNLSPQKKVPLILVKANICRLLESKLTAEGFEVLNGGIVVPFPSTGQQSRFHDQIGKVLRQKMKYA